jgi:hypothetical protein
LSILITLLAVEGSPLAGDEAVFEKKAFRGRGFEIS